MAHPMATMLKGMGFDVEDLVSKFESMQKYLQSVDAALARIEKKQDKILAILNESQLEVIEQDGNGNTVECNRT